MIKHFFVFSLRLFKSRNVSFIQNVLGLSLGFFSSLSAFYLLTTETGFNNQFPEKETLARVVSYANKYETAIASTPFNLAPAISNTYPEIISICRSGRMMVDLDVDPNTILEEEVLFTDTSFIHMFGFELIHGDPYTALLSPQSLILTEEYARKLFGRKNPLGEVLTISWYKYSTDLTVTGVLKDPGPKTTIPFNLLGNIAMAREYFRNKDLDIGKSNGDGWVDMNYITYIRVQRVDSFQGIEEKLNEQGVEDYPGYFDLGYRIQPMKDIYFSTMEVLEDPSPHGSKKMLIIINVIGFLILFVSSINFIILSTSQSIVRAKEFGIRKVFGANSKYLRSQIISEYFLYACIAVIIAFVLMELFYPTICQWLNKDADFSFWDNPMFIPGALAVMVLTVFFSTFYLNFFVTRSNPIQSISGVENKQGINITFQRVLIGFQLLLFCIIVSSLLSVNKQIQYIKNSSPGMKMENLLVLSSPVISEKRNEFRVFKEKLLTDNSIRSICTANNPALPTHLLKYFPMKVVGKEDQMEAVYCDMINVNYDFTETFGVQLKNGRALTQENFPSRRNCCLITESCVKALEIADPIGATLSVLDGAMNPQVVGVVEDFNVTSYYSKAKPIVLILDPEYIDSYYIRLNENSNSEHSIRWIKETWEEVFPGYPLEYSFFIDDYKSLYDRTNATLKTVLMFSVFASVLCIIGLFGMSNHLSNLRVKEMSLRRLYGASIESNLISISMPLMILTLICNLISIPISILIFRNWLNQFAFQTTNYHNQVILTMLFSAIIVLLAIGGNIFKTVRRPIAKVLKERE